ncbi:MAG: L-aspartate oxidase [Acidobacteria bacterium]|nr:L-aspartate oxidase [Acidobacteriota bacterium]MBI3663697.1 L-aspartate oxidase [Acidobacteriota bacterium]
MKPGDPIQVDFAIVGCGIAGLRAAVEVAQHGTVLVLAKSELSETATEWAQGGIAAVLSDEDEISLHEQDTIAAGDGLCNPEAVKVLVEEGPRYIQQLIEWGTQFDRAGTRLAFTREGAHSRSRVLHAHGDSTGREISRALMARANALPGISFRAYALTTELLLDRGRVSGLRFLDESSGATQDVRAGAVLLATGGLGHVYRETTNPAVATGDGMAIAYDAGAVLTDLEFVQFHPTALCVKGAPRFLLSEALRGEGGILRNADLHRFMKHYHEAGELAPRDIVARAIVAEMHKTGAEFVYLDMTGLDADYVRKRFPRIHATCQTFGLDIATDLIPVRPAAHYAMGGVMTDLLGRTTLPGLYAAGETAGTGVHGANRLASNSLLEGLVFGARAGIAMAGEVHPENKQTAAACASSHGHKRPKVNLHRDNPGHSKHGNNPGHGHPPSPAASGPPPGPFDQIRNILWREVGIIRSGRDLNRALEQLRALDVERPGKLGRAECELHNVWTLAQLITRCALAREESRGSHYRSDFPFPDDEKFRKHSLISRDSKVAFE